MVNELPQQLVLNVNSLDCHQKYTIKQYDSQIATANHHYINPDFLVHSLHEVMCASLKQSKRLLTVTSISHVLPLNTMHHFIIF